MITDRQSVEFEKGNEDLPRFDVIYQLEFVAHNLISYSYCYIWQAVFSPTLAVICDTLFSCSHTFTII